MRFPRSLMKIAGFGPRSTPGRRPPAHGRGGRQESSFLPVFWCVPPTILRGTAAGGGIALTTSIGNLGGFVGPNLLGLVKDAKGSFASGLLALAGLALVGSVLPLGLRRHLGLDRIDFKGK